MEDKRTRILVADDDSFVRDMLASILESSGYLVSTAEDGNDALEKFGSGGADLIISDMNMPVLDGLGLIRKLREAGRDVPVIILTGNSEISVAIEALKGGASDYLLKDENIQDTITIAVEKVWEKYQLKLQNVRLMEDLARKNERLEKEKALAQSVQKNILPGALHFDGVTIETFYRPSDQIGGDFFDAWESGGSVHFIIGDVSGHSTSAALIMAVCKGTFHSLGHVQDSPVEIVRTANRMLCDIVGDSGMFLSAVYGVYDRRAGELKIVSAGHNPVFLVEGGSVAAIEASGAVMGWDPEDSWDVHSVAFGGGARLVLYTDGLTEARSAAGEEFGEDRLVALLKRQAAAGGTVEGIVREVEGFSGGEFSDDLTIFILKRD